MNATLVGLWCVALAVVAVYTANPPIVNRVQVLHADLIVSGTVVDPAHGVIAVDRAWKQPAPKETLNVANLSWRLQEGEAYLIPLTRRADGRYEITHGKLTNAVASDGAVITSTVAPQVYRATPELSKQLVALLADEDRTAANPPERP